MKADKNPEKILVINLDGAAQKYYQLPHYAQNRKDLDQLPRLEGHLMGAIVTGYFDVALFDYNQFSHNANHVISVLFAIIQFIANGGNVARRKKPKTFPREMFLQLDNAQGQNKNTAMIRFCGFLVHLDIFQKVCFYNHLVSRCILLFLDYCSLQFGWPHT